MNPVQIGSTLNPWGGTEPLPVFVPRDKHRFILGTTGSGKSTSMKLLALADIEAGDGCTVIDPHGSLVDDLITRIPKNRTNDVIWWNPTDENVIGLNSLEGDDPVRALEQTLKIISTIWGENAWGPQSDYIARNVGLAVMEVERRPTILHLLRFFNDKSYAAHLGRNVTNPTVKGFFSTLDEVWDKRQQAIASAPPQNKVDSLLSNPVVRDVLGQETGLDIGRAMDSRKIVLCRFSKGILGPEAGAFLSSVLLSKILFAALEREGKKDRPFHGVYVDEFHNSSRGNSTEFILSETRKYNIALTVADQTIAQLPEGSEAALFGNVSSLIVGRLGYKDADRLVKELGPPLQDAATLQGLQNYHWYMKSVREDGFVTRAIPFVGSNLPKRGPDCQRKKVVIEKSRTHWGVPRGVVQTKIAAILGGF